MGFQPCVHHIASKNISLFFVQGRSRFLELQPHGLFAGCELQVAELLTHGCGVRVAFYEAFEGALCSGTVPCQGQVFGIGNLHTLGVRALFHQLLHPCSG